MNECVLKYLPPLPPSLLPSLTFHHAFKMYHSRLQARFLLAVQPLPFLLPSLPPSLLCWYPELVLRMKVHTQRPLSKERGQHPSLPPSLLHLHRRDQCQEDRDTLSPYPSLPPSLLPLEGGGTEEREVISMVGFEEGLGA